MKKMRIVLCIVILLLMCFNIWAQTPEEKYYVKNFDIMKIYVTPYGYKIRYWKAGAEYADIYIPLEWFDSDPKKAVIAYDNKPSYPYFMIIWKDGKLNYIKICARRNKKHLTWGSLRPSSALAQNFKDVEELRLSIDA